MITWDRHHTFETGALESDAPQPNVFVGFVVSAGAALAMWGVIFLAIRAFV